MPQDFLKLAITESELISSQHPGITASYNCCFKAAKAAAKPVFSSEAFTSSSPSFFNKLNTGSSENEHMKVARKCLDGMTGCRLAIASLACSLPAMEWNVGVNF